MKKGPLILQYDLTARTKGEEDSNVVASVKAGTRSTRLSSTRELSSISTIKIPQLVFFFFFFRSINDSRERLKESISLALVQRLL
jgi:hypothetical protein